MTKEKATIHNEQANNKNENKLTKSEKILPSKLREIDTDLNFEENKKKMTLIKE